MSKQEEIIEVCGKKVLVRQSNESTDCCGKCAFWANTCTAEDDMMRIPCQKYDKDGKYAYFVLAERPKPIIIAQESPVNNTEADLEAEIDCFYGMYRKDGKTYDIEDDEVCADWKEMCNPYFEIAFARHFAEWERKRTLDKVVEWMKKNLTYVHPRKGVETCMVNIPAFLDTMNEENT